MHDPIRPKYGQFDQVGRSARELMSDTEDQDILSPSSGKVIPIEM